MICNKRTERRLKNQRSARNFIHGARAAFQLKLNVVLRLRVCLFGLWGKLLAPATEHCLPRFSLSPGKLSQVYLGDFSAVLTIVACSVSHGNGGAFFRRGGENCLYCLRSGLSPALFMLFCWPAFNYRIRWGLLSGGL